MKRYILLESGQDVYEVWTFGDDEWPHGVCTMFGEFRNHRGTPDSSKFLSMLNEETPIPGLT